MAHLIMIILISSKIHRNQEYLEDLKQNIAEKQTKENENMQASTRSLSVLNSIKLTIIDLIHKLEEVYITTGSVELVANEHTPTNTLLQVISNASNYSLA